MTTELIASFNYGLLDAEASKLAKDAAAYIGVRAQSVTRSMIEIGSKLIEVKETLGHGHFQTWVEAELNWSIRSVQNYMKAAQTFEGKSETVAHLPVSTVYQLARAPEPVREEVVKRIATEHLSVDQVEEIVWTVNQERKQANANARKTPRQIAREKKQREEARLRHEKFMAEMEAQRQAEEDAIKGLASLILSKMPEDQHELIRLAKVAGHQRLAECLHGG